MKAGLAFLRRNFKVVQRPGRSNRLRGLGLALMVTLATVGVLRLAARFFCCILATAGRLATGTDFFGRALFSSGFDPFCRLWVGGLGGALATTRDFTE